MSRKLLTIFAIFALLYGAACAVDVPITVSTTGVVKVASGVNAADQWAIPRYANGSTHPAGSYIGNGRSSILTGNVNTQDEDTPAVVVTEDADGNLAQWDNNSGGGLLEAVLQPEVRDLTIAGYSEQGAGWPSGGVVNDNPGTWNPASSFSDREHGLYIKASAPRIQNVNFFYIPGTACWILRGGGSSGGAVTPYDSEKFIISDCNVARSYRGFRLETIDGIVGNLSGFALRDYGLYVPDLAGALQFVGAIHFWGITSVPASSGADPAPCMWFDGSAGACWGSGPFYVETSDIGMKIESSRNIFSNIYSKVCYFGSLNITGARNIIDGFDIEVYDGVTETNSAQGVLVANQNTTLRNGYMTVPNGEVGIRVTNGTHQVIDRVNFLGASSTGTGTGIKVESTINNSVINVNFQWLGGGVGLDLLDGSTDRIGTGNVIHVTHQSDGGEFLSSEACQLHGDWTTTPDSSEDNEVYINGVRYYRD